MNTYRRPIMLASVLASTATVGAADPLVLDFDEGVAPWRIVVDGVMGGRSSGRVEQPEPGILRFTGNLSLANNGGFSQMRRSVNGDRFAETRGVEMRVRGDGRTYKFDVRVSNARMMAGGFQQDFETRAGEWSTVRLPFEAFRLYSFGRLVNDAPALDPTKIESIGVTLSDKIEGPFRLEIDSIRAFGGSNASSSAAEDLAAAARESGLNRLRELVAAANAGPATDPVATADATPRTNSAPARAEAARLCELAIARGVPQFNAGRPAACASIYEVTIEAMIALGGESLGSDVIRRLEMAMLKAKTDQTWSDRAWTYRRALDDVYARLSRPAVGRQTATR